MRTTSVKILRASLVVGAASILLYVWKSGSRSSMLIAEERPRISSLVHTISPKLNAPASLALEPTRDEKSLLSGAARRAHADEKALSLLEHELNQAVEISSEEERKNALVIACLHWADSNPADALDLARRFGLGQVSDSLCEDIAQKWAGSDFTAALTWANRESPGEQRDRVIARLAFVRAQTEPAAAATLVASQIPAGPTLDEASISVAHQWALRDLGGAFAWVDRFPSGDLRDRALSELALVARYHLAPSEGRY
jgi:hypothetical protein